jgi:uncharacterized protein (DUF1330 family)
MANVDRLNVTIGTLRQEGMSKRQIVDHLVGVYCPMVAQQSSLTEVEKNAQVQRFTGQVTQLVYWTLSSMYRKDFLPKAQANIKEGGGKYLAGGFNKTISMSGSPPPARVVLLQFSDMDTLKAFNVKQRQLEAELGDKYASFRGVAIEGVEQK